MTCATVNRDATVDRADGKWTCLDCGGGERQRDDGKRCVANVAFELLTLIEFAKDKAIAGERRNLEIADVADIAVQIQAQFSDDCFAHVELLFRQDEPDERHVGSESGWGRDRVFAQHFQFHWRARSSLSVEINLQCRDGDVAGLSCAEREREGLNHSHLAVGSEGTDLDQWITQNLQASDSRKIRRAGKLCVLNGKCERDVLSNDDGIPVQRGFESDGVGREDSG